MNIKPCTFLPIGILLLAGSRHPAQGALASAGCLSCAGGQDIPGLFAATIHRLAMAPPRASPRWRCAHGHFGEFLADYEARYQSDYGFLRPAIREAVLRSRVHPFP